ncbi:RHS repeat-associated core domain-containing protein [Rhodanobacter sp. L36]|uniref:RHS repeat-associated core domain-containing protein n=1 Tax=Rhodanobacter sp. L36 TaxID=1747221 RepID=UPI00131B0754|nr:RHS repeat-associated core domain-containing protein [Rhodanobacter sp. L36]
MKLALIMSAAVLLGLGRTTHAGSVTYVYTDPHGTPLAEADATGTITAKFDYAPYGAASTASGMSGAPNGPGYSGHVNDPESGLVYMQARYYDPNVGRFISTDQVAPDAGNSFSFNRYAYANNGPVVHDDPTGMAPGDPDDFDHSAYPVGVTMFGGNDDSGSESSAPPQSSPNPTTGAPTSTQSASTDTPTSTASQIAAQLNGYNNGFDIVPAIDFTSWKVAAEITEGESASVISRGGILVQANSVGGPFKTDAFGFYVGQRPLDLNGNYLSVSASQKWSDPTYNSSGLTGYGAGHSFRYYALPGPGGNKWTVTFPLQEDWHQNASFETIRIYTPMHN